jgi:hypothetical protein
MNRAVRAALRFEYFRSARDLDDPNTARRFLGVTGEHPGEKQPNAPAKSEGGSVALMEFLPTGNDAVDALGRKNIEMCVHFSARVRHEV